MGKLSYNVSLNTLFELLLSLKDDEYTTLYNTRASMKYSHSALEVAAANLKRLNLVKSKHGSGGGYRLTRPLCDVKIKTFIKCVKLQQPVLHRALVHLSEMSVEEFVKSDIK